MTGIFMLILSGGIGGAMSRPAVGPQSPAYRPGNLRITEIMADPDPPVGLPAYEYVEWHNPGPDTVSLAGWQWVVGDKARLLEGGIIPPGGYLIVCPVAAASLFRPYGDVLAMTSFPALRNSGDRLTLVSPEGVAVHTVEYSSDRFSDALQAGGGWSLELADLNQYCNPLAWLPSADPSGGSPGRAGTRTVSLEPADSVRLLRAAGLDDHRFVLLFSGTLDPALRPNNYSCRLQPGDIVVNSAAAPSYGFPGLCFTLPEGIDPETLYTIELEGMIADCEGRSVVLAEVPFGTPAAPDSADVVITEVLFDPLSGQPEFVEVYNRSDHLIELQELILARADPGGTVSGFSDSQEGSFWLFPGGYAVFTSDGAAFARTWPDARAALAVRSDLPALTNEESRLILLDQSQRVLDVAGYSPDWHYPYLDEDKGISLERMSAAASGADKGNWFSAPASTGGASPGRANNCVMQPPADRQEMFVLEPATGISVNAGEPVRMALSYRFEEPGWFLRVVVHNARGQPVRELMAFGLAPISGLVTWDGLDMEGSRVPEGIYLLVADYYHPSGRKGRWKKACSVLRDY